MISAVKLSKSKRKTGVFLKPAFIMKLGEIVKTGIESNSLVNRPQLLCTIDLWQWELRYRPVMMQLDNSIGSR